MTEDKLIKGQEILDKNKDLNSITESIDNAKMYINKHIILGFGHEGRAVITVDEDVVEEVIALIYQRSREKINKLETEFEEL